MLCAQEKGSAKPSFVASWLSKLSDRLQSQDDRERLLKLLETAAGSAFAAGSETVRGLEFSLCG